MRPLRLALRSDRAELGLTAQSRARRLLPFSAAQVMLVAIVPTAATLASIDVRSITGSLGLGIALASQLGGGAAALIMLRASPRLRLRPPVAGFVALAAGASLCGVGVASGQLGVALTGDVLLGAGAALAQLLRLPVAEDAGLHRKGRAVGAIATVAASGSILGPFTAQMAVPVGAAVALAPEPARWSALAVLAVAGAVLARIGAARVGHPARSPAPLAAPAAKARTPRSLVVASIVSTGAMMTMIAAVAVTVAARPRRRPGSWCRPRDRDVRPRLPDRRIRRSGRRPCDAAARTAHHRPLPSGSLRPRQRSQRPR